MDAGLKGVAVQLSAFVIEAQANMPQTELLARTIMSRIISGVE